MQASFAHLHHRSRRGSTLVLAVFVVALLAVFIGLAFDYTGNTALNARRARDLSVGQALANGALEAAYKRWQVYMATKQNLPFSNYTNVNDFKTNCTNALLTPLRAAAAGAGFSLASDTDLSILPVDRTDTVQSVMDQTYASYQPISNVPGWNAKTFSYRARVRLTKSSDPSFVISVSRYFQEADASLFQAMLFFQNDLELHPGADMNLYGPIHSNVDIFMASSANLVLNSPVTYHGENAATAALRPAANQPASQNLTYGNYKTSNDGYFEGVTQALYDQEKPNWTAYNDPNYSTGFQHTQVQSLDPLGTDAATSIDPTNANASGTHEIIERPVPTSASNPSARSGVADPQAYSAHRMFNNAGLRILINRNSSTNGGRAVRVYQPVDLVTDPENSTEIVPGSAQAPNIANQVINAITTTDSIYDFREGKTVSLDTIDVSKLTPALNAYSDYNGVLYVSDTTHADANGNTGNSDAIRLTRGGVLPGAINGVNNVSGVEGMTVVSDGGVYVQGDYNTNTQYDPKTRAIIPSTQPPSDTVATPDATTSATSGGYVQKPASVMGDAVMILSNSWNDALSSQGVNQRIATPTTMNAAIVSGQVLTTTGAGSGGAHNFPRFLETWGTNFVYHGSMCELYPSTHFTGTYGKGNVYTAPKRRWYFDDNFLQTPPPGNLRSTTYSRGRWMRNNLL